MKKTPLLCIIALALSASAGRVLAMAGTDDIPKPLDPRSLEDWGFPTNALSLLNDPRRVAGWHPWFSELPNNAYWFAYRAKSIDDVNQLIAIFAKLKSDEVVLELSPLDGGQRVRGLD